MTFPTFSEAELAKLPKDTFAFLKWQMEWTSTARPNQIPPELDPETGLPWLEYGAMSGRGWGKTKCGAEWLARAVFEDPSGHPSAVVCPTLRDVKKVAFQGPAGLLNVIPPELVVDYNRSDFLITMKNIAGGTAQIQGFTSEQPESLRGPNHTRAWCDEIAAWENEEDTFDMLELTMRLGDYPQILWTSTPKPKDLIRRLAEPKPGRIIVTGSTYENKANLAPPFLEKITRFEGTRLGAQELHGQLLNMEDSGIVKRSQFRLWPHDRPLPAFDWIVVSLDTAFTERTRAREGDTKTDTMKGDPDATACTVWGTFRHDKRMNVLLLDCWEDHLGLPELIRRTRKEMNQAYGDDADRPMVQPLIGPSHSSGFGRRPDVLLIEDKGSGISLRQMLEREGIIAFPYNPGRADKLTRLHVVSPVFARRLVWLPESEHPERKGKPKSWVEPMLAQICSFTGSGSIKHDDFVDACSQAFRFLIDKQMLDVSLPQREQREREIEARDKGFEREARRGAVVNPYNC